MEPKDQGQPHGDKPKSRRGGKRESNKPKCGATSKSTGKPCPRVAGWGTDHKGTGRCRNHGGCTPILHGLYSKTISEERKQVIEALLNLPDEQLFSLRREVAFTKAIIHEIAEVTAGVTLAVLPEGHEAAAVGNIAMLTEANRLVLLLDCMDKGTKIVERYEKIEESRSGRYTDKLIQDFLRRLYGLIVTKRYDFSKPDHIAAFGKDLATLDPSGGFVPTVPQRLATD